MTQLESFSCIWGIVAISSKNTPTLA